MYETGKTALWIRKVEAKKRSTHMSLYQLEPPYRSGTFGPVSWVIVSSTALDDDLEPDHPGETLVVVSDADGTWDSGKQLGAIDGQNHTAALLAIGYNLKFPGPVARGEPTRR